MKLSGPASFILNDPCVTFEQSVIGGVSSSTFIWGLLDKHSGRGDHIHSELAHLISMVQTSRACRSDGWEVASSTKPVMQLPHASITQHHCSLVTSSLCYFAWPSLLEIHHSIFQPQHRYWIGGLGRPHG